MDFIQKLQKAFSSSAKKVSTCGTTFWLSSYLTSAGLFAAALVMTSRQYWGDPIDCIQTESGIPAGMLDTSCWVHTTFITPRDLLPAYGETSGSRVGPALSTHGSGPKAAERIYIAYYQWVCFGLLILTAMAAAPYFTWRAVGGAYIAAWLTGLKSDDTKVIEAAISAGRLQRRTTTQGGEEEESLLPETYAEEKTFRSLAARLRYEANGCGRGGAGGKLKLARKYILCEWLTFIFSQAQYWFLVWFLGQNFLTYGWD